MKNLFWMKLILTVFIIAQLCLTASAQDEEPCVTDEDCDSDELAEEGRTTCCDLDDKKGCCDKGAKWDKIRNLAVGIGVTTVCLALVVFVVMWCNPDTFPCLKTCREDTSRKYHQWEDKQSCCARRSKRRHLAEERDRKEASIPSYWTPDEIKADVSDDFWNTGSNI